MKKLLLTLLLLPSSLYADSITNGSVGLLKISTGVVGTRNWGDKYNENFQIIANTITTIQNNITTLNTSITSSNTAIYATIYSTFLALNSTAAAVSNYQASMNSTVTAIINSTATLETSLSQRTVVGYNGGVALGGNLTAINTAGATASQSGSTLTITVTAASGGGSKAYSLIVGTAGTPGVDMFVNNLQQFNMALASIGACGLTTSATGYGTILFKDGNYPILGATVPAGVYLFGASSSVWQMANGTNTLVTNYGRIDGFKFDLGGGIGARLISLSTNSRLTNFLFYNSTGLANGASSAYQYAILSVKKSSNIVIQGDWRDLRVPTGAGNYGDNAPFKIEDSSSVDVRINVAVNGVDGVASVFLYVLRSNQINIHDGYYDGIGGNFFDFENGNANITFARNRCVIDKTAGTSDGGIVMFSGQTVTNLPISTGSMVVENNTFDIHSADAGIIIGSNGNGGASAIINGLVVRNNSVNVTSLPAVPYKFANISSVVKGAVLQGNVTRGLQTFIVDGGLNTLYLNQGNTLYNVEQ